MKKLTVKDFDTFAVLKTLIKVLITLRYGMDTISQGLAHYDYAITDPISSIPPAILLEVGFDFLLIDAMLLFFWILASYTGKSNKFEQYRLPATVGAVFMYIAMWTIAGSTNSLVTFVARGSGLALLVFDIWANIVTLYTAVNKKSEKEAVEVQQKRLRMGLWKIAYLARTLTNGLALTYRSSKGVLLEDLQADVTALSYIRKESEKEYAKEIGMLSKDKPPVEQSREIKKTKTGYYWVCLLTGKQGKEFPSIRGAKRSYTHYYQSLGDL